MINFCFILFIGKQILDAMIYLKNKDWPPLYNLHSGNAIFGDKKQSCLLTGYEEAIFVSKTRADDWFELNMRNIYKRYLIYDESSEFLLRRAKTDYELKRIAETMRYGYLIVEMCTGQELLSLLPEQNSFNLIKERHPARAYAELYKFIDFIFFNQRRIKDQLGNNEIDEKLKKKFVIPELEEIISNEFFNGVMTQTSTKASSTIPNEKQKEL
jgi:hypothetical protein